MKIYKPNTKAITVLGIAYFADENGVIDVPDSKVGSGIWGRGFVSAEGHLAELDRLRSQGSNTAAAIIEQPAETAVADPVKKPLATEKPKLS